MLEDLKELKGWPEHIKEAQKLDWEVGRVIVKFKILADGKFSVLESPKGKTRASFYSKIFHRLHSLEVLRRGLIRFGCTYVVLSPESKIIEELKGQIKNWGEVEKYIEEAKNKTDLQRTDLAKK